MMMDIFSSFDPMFYQNLFNPYLFWWFPIFMLILSNTNLWLFNNPTQILNSQIMKFMSMQTAQTSINTLKGASHMLPTLFLLMITLNLSGLAPYSFSTTSHLIITLSIGLPMWLTLILSSITKSPYMTAANLLPSGAPDWLNPFLIIIETTSMLVRPLTLSFRLAANMSAGHIVMTLISIYLSSAFFTSMNSLMFLLLLNIMYMFFELGICLIQSYIFCLLISLYANDHQ